MCVGVYVSLSMRILSGRVSRKSLNLLLLPGVSAPGPQQLALAVVFFIFFTEQFAILFISIFFASELARFSVLAFLAETVSLLAK
jgi:hypothetical protein